MPAHLLPAWDDTKYIAQAKIAGTYVIIQSVGPAIRVWDRLQNPLNIAPPDVSRLLQGNTMLCGQLLDTGQPDGNGDVLTGVVLHDIVQYQNEYLYGSSYQSRYELLQSICQPETGDYLLPVSDGLFLIRNFNEHFAKTYCRLAAIPMIEGLVIKTLNVPLRYAKSPDKHTDGMINFLKPF